MTWLLDTIEDHRAAVKYDLLAHGYRLEWLATERLPWGDAVTILTMQPPSTSALFREVHPDDYDRSAEVQRLEFLAVLLARHTALQGNHTDVSEAELPKSWDDLFDRPAPVAGDDQPPALMSFAEIDVRMGWAN